MFVTSGSIQTLIIYLFILFHFYLSQRIEQSKWGLHINFLSQTLTHTYHPTHRIHSRVVVQFALPQTYKLMGIQVSLVYSFERTFLKLLLSLLFSRNFLQARRSFVWSGRKKLLPWWRVNTTKVKFKTRWWDSFLVNWRGMFRNKRPFYMKGTLRIYSDMRHFKNLS